MDEIDKYYLLIAENPYLFSISHDRFLHARAFRQVPVSGYIITCRVDEGTKEVNLMGFQHQRQEPVKGLF